MNKRLLTLCVGLLSVVVVLPGCRSYQQTAFEVVETKTHAGVTPANRDNQRHRNFNARVKQGNVDLVFIGDSITQGWEEKGKEVWEKYYGRRKAVNLGIGGDRTEHILWRLDNGNVDGIQPKVAVVMIGTNNLSKNRSKVEETADGITAICKRLRSKLPDTKVLLLGIFPREQKPGELRENVRQTNKLISKLADGRHIFYLDIGKKFVQPDGTISKEVMPDFLHLSARGYEIWAQAIEQKLAELMGEKKRCGDESRVSMPVFGVWARPANTP